MIGICNLSNIPLRLEADNRSEIVSQLLFGETYTVTDQTDEWIKIITHDDQYSGWISMKQHEPIQSNPQTNTVSCVFPYVIATSGKGKVMIPAGSCLPDLSGNEFKINETSYTLNDQNIIYTIEDLGNIALQYKNVPYLWGGRSPFGIDCSGFVQTVYKQIGIQLKRDASQQAEQGERVSFLEESKCGDLAFFDNDEGKIVHVGLMLDKQTIIHASGRVRVDSIDNFGIMNMEENHYSHKLRIIKRITG
jgi:hypothetical protein